MWSREGLKSGSSTTMPMMYRSTPHLFVYQAEEEDDVEVGIMDDDVETEPSDSGYADSTRSVGAASSGGGSATTPEAIYYSPMDLAQRKEKEAIRRLSLKYGGDGGNAEVYSNGSSAGSSSSGDSADDSAHPVVNNKTQLTELELLRVETFFRGNQTQIFVGKSLANL